jgi:hypothetical protein
MLKRRGSGTSHDPRPKKAQKTSVASSSRAGPNPDRIASLDPFHPSNEISFRNLKAVLEASEPYKILPGFAYGRVVMVWARSPAGKTRFMLIEHSAASNARDPTLEVVMKGNKLKALDDVIIHGMVIKLALRSAQMELWRTHKPNSLPFKLVYEEAMLMQVANSQGEEFETLDFSMCSLSSNLIAY